MQKKPAEKKLFGVAEIVMDENLVLGTISQEDYKGKYFDEFEEIKLENLKLCTKEYEWQGKVYRRQVFSHPDLSYYLSPYYLGAVMRYIEHSFNGTADLFAIKEKHQPFLVKVRTPEEAYEGPAFFIAPTIFEEEKESKQI